MADCCTSPHICGTPKKLPPNLNDLLTLEINLEELRSLLSKTRVSDEIIGYAARIVRATRETPSFKRGASLRAILGVWNVNHATLTVVLSCCAPVVLCTVRHVPLGVC